MRLGELYSLAISMEGSINALIIILIVLALIAIILIVLEMRFRKKIETSTNNRDLFYQRKLEELSNSKERPEKVLDSLNKLTRDFFKEAFNLRHNLEYSELIEIFRKAKKKECVSFCYLMLTLNYSGERVEQDEINVLIGLFGEIIKKNRISPEEAETETKTEQIENKPPSETFKIIHWISEKFSKIKEKMLGIFRRKNTPIEIIEQGEIQKPQIKEEPIKKGRIIPIEPGEVKKPRTKEEPIKKDKTMQIKNKLDETIRFINKRDPIQKLEGGIEAKLKRMLDRTKEERAEE